MSFYITPTTSVMNSTSTLVERVERERYSHTVKDVMAEHNKLKGRFPHNDTYPSTVRLSDLYQDYMRNLDGLTILDYGCGRGDMALQYLNNGATKIHGIDISDVYVAHADEQARKHGFSPNRFDFQVMDAHNLSFPDNSFDIVAGWSILHHLDAETAMNEVYRVLKPGGRVLFWEPLADHPMLKVFRWLTPQARTVDEAPFTGTALKRIVEQNNWRSELAYCGLIEGPVAMLTSVLIPNHPDNFLLRIADKIERWTHEKKILTSWNQRVLFNLVKQV